MYEFEIASNMGLVVVISLVENELQSFSDCLLDFDLLL